MTRTRQWLSIAMLGAVVAGCGGGGGPAPVVVAPPAQAGNEVPASAYASSAAYRQYAAALAVSESSEPLDVSKVTPPTSETEDAAPI